MDCVFCKIAAGEVEADIVLDTENLVVFPDQNPHAMVHLLIIPKKHYKDITETPVEVWIEIKKAILDLKEKYNTEGFRLVNNFGKSAQIKHMHVHFLTDVDIDKKL